MPAPLRNIFSRLKKIENAFLVFWLILGCSVAVFVPPYVGMDEGSHVARAQQIADGVFLPSTIDVEAADTRILGTAEEFKNSDIYGGDTDSSLYNLLATIGPIVHDDNEKSSISFPWWTDSRVDSNAQVGQSKITWAFPAATIYSAVCYLPHSIAYLLAVAFQMTGWSALILMRLLGVVVYGLIVRYAIKVTPIAKNVMLLVAVMPDAIAINTMVSADTMTTAFCFLYIAYILKLVFRYREFKGRDYVGLGISLCALALLKMPYIAFGLLLFLPFFLNRMWQRKADVRRLLAIGVSSLFLFLIWYSCIKNVNPYTLWGPLRGIDADAQIAYILSNPAGAMTAIWNTVLSTDIALLSMNATGVQVFTVWVLIFAYAFAIGRDSNTIRQYRGKGATATSLILISILIIFAIILSMYITYNSVGADFVDGCQGRYFIPVLLTISVAIVLICSNTKQKSQVLGRQQLETLLQQNSAYVSESVSIPMIVIMIAFYGWTVRAYDWIF